MLTNDNILTILSERSEGIEITLTNTVNEVSADDYREMYEQLYEVSPSRFKVKFQHNDIEHTADVQRQANRYTIYPQNEEKSQVLNGFVMEKDHTNKLNWGDSWGEIRYLSDISSAILAQEPQ